MNETFPQYRKRVIAEMMRDYGCTRKAAETATDHFKAWVESIEDDVRNRRPISAAVADSAYALLGEADWYHCFRDTICVGRFPDGYANPKIRKEYKERTGRSWPMPW